MNRSSNIVFPYLSESWEPLGTHTSNVDIILLIGTAPQFLCVILSQLLWSSLSCSVITSS